MKRGRRGRSLPLCTGGGGGMDCGAGGGEHSSGGGLGTGAAVITSRNRL